MEETDIRVIHSMLRLNHRALYIPTLSTTSRTERSSKHDTKSNVEMFWEVFSISATARISLYPSTRIDYENNKCDALFSFSRRLDQFTPIPNCNFQRS